MSYIKTKYEGVEYRTKQNGEKTFYIRFRANGKLHRERLGTDKEGFSAKYCYDVRAERMSTARLGEYAPLNKKKEPTIDTFGSIAIKYLDSIKEQSDYKNTVGRYDNHLRPIFANKDLKSITIDDVQKFRDKKAKEVSFKTGRHFANKTINDMTNLIHTIYNYAINVEGIDVKSPAVSKRKKQQGKGIVKLNEDNARQRYLTKDEINVLYDAIKNRKGREEVTKYLYIFTKLALNVGARLTSVLNIQKKDINIQDKTVTIKDFKNGDTYKGFLNDELIELLDLDNLKANDYIVGRGIKPLQRSSINKSLQPLLNELFNDGLSTDDAQNRVVIHTLRHTFGSLLAINGTPIFTIQKLMNHKSLDMTMRYAKLAPDQGRNEVANLGL